MAAFKVLLNEDRSAASFDGLGTDRDLGSAAYGPADFPGCESFHLPASEIDGYEGRLEFWDGVTETAWKVCGPTSIYHEQPSRRLGRIAERVASLRGSAIECFGSADLVRLDAAGRKRWLMQADEVLYLHPDRVRLQGPAIDVDADPLPDVVLSPPPVCVAPGVTRSIGDRPRRCSSVELRAHDARPDGRHPVGSSAHPGGFFGRELLDLREGYAASLDQEAT